MFFTAIKILTNNFLLLRVFIISMHKNLLVNKTKSTKHASKKGSSGLVSISVLRLPEGLVYYLSKGVDKISIGKTVCN